MKEIELKMFKQSYITQIRCINDRAKQTEKKLTSISCKKTTKRAINRLQKKTHTLYFSNASIQNTACCEQQDGIQLGII